MDCNYPDEYHSQYKIYSYAQQLRTMLLCIIKNVLLLFTGRSSFLIRHLKYKMLYYIIACLVYLSVLNRMSTGNLQSEHELKRISHLCFSGTGRQYATLVKGIYSIAIRKFFQLLHFGLIFSSNHPPKISFLVNHDQSHKYKVRISFCFNNVLFF